MSWLPAEPQHQSASGQLDELEPVDQLQQRARLFPHLLRPAQVAGIVIGDPRLDPPLRFFEGDFRQELAHIPNLAAERLGPSRPTPDHPSGKRRIP